jgi:hypothetical protein
LHGLAAFISRRPSSGAGNDTAKSKHGIVSAIECFGPI